MEFNRFFQCKIIFSFATSLLFIPVVSQATNPAKGGSFGCVIPVGGGISKCPSPYDPLTIVLENKTDSVGVTGGNANAIWANIYYLPMDTRPYYGEYRGYNANNAKSFPTEIRGNMTPTGQVYNDPTSGGDLSGPIIGTTLLANSNGAKFYPARSWSRYSGGISALNLDSGAGVQGGSVMTPYRGNIIGGQAISDQYGWRNNPYIQVATISNLKNERMDLKGSDFVTLPIRSFERIRIEVLAGINSKKVPLTGPTKQGDQVEAVGMLIAGWEGYAVSSKNGTTLKTYATYLKNDNGQYIGWYSNSTGETDNNFADKDKTMTPLGIINTLSADSIHITMKGTWKPSQPAPALLFNEFFAGSSIELKKLKVRDPVYTDSTPMGSTATSADLNCD